MKKAWMMFFVLAIAALPAAAANITVSAPTAGAALEIGKSLPITWTFAGLPASTKVSIFLCQGSIKLGNIVQNLAIGSAGQGAFDWSAGAYIGGTATAGSDFFIKIRTGDGSVTGKSGLFTLAAKPGNTGGTLPPPPAKQPIRVIGPIGQVGYPCLAITAPKKNDSCDPNNIISIKWNRNGTQDANVSITLLRTGKGVILHGVTVAASAPNSGTFNWNPVSLMPAPGLCKLRIRTLDGKCEAHSDEFSIAEVGGIELLTPKGGEIWENGSTHAVTWKRMGNIRTVDIMLARENSWTKVIAQGVDAKLGTRPCVFPKDPNDQGPYLYRLFINHSAGGSSNMSGWLTLTGNPDLAVSASFIPTMPNIGTNVTFSIKIENKGVVKSQPCQGDFYVNGAVDQAFQVPAIDPGATATASIIWKLACPAAVKIIIDPGQVNVEPDKANNAWEKPLCTN